MHAGCDLRCRRRPSPEALRREGTGWESRLDPASGRALYIPEGCAHGFQTLVDETDVAYMISAPYAPDAAAGVRWDDPTIAIAWPGAAKRTISERDRALPAYGVV